MSWTDSRVFAAFAVNPMLAAPSALPTGYGGLVADTVKAALFGSGATPDRTAAVGSTGYGTGTWTSANEVSASSEWVAGGRALSGGAFTNVSGTVAFSALNLTGSATLTLSGVYGCLVYDASITGGTVADQGVCYNYFGGSQSVVSGTFSVAWPNGGQIFEITT